MKIQVNLTIEEVLVQYRKIIKQRDELLDACKLALEHLEYCNYGDKWEKECAIESGLPEKLHTAIQHVSSEASNLGTVPSRTAKTLTQNRGRS